MPAGLALALMPLLWWEAWRLLAGRLGDGTAALPLLAVGAAAAWPALRRLSAGAAPAVPLGFLSALLVPYILATFAAPPLIVAASAVGGFVLLLRKIAGDGAPLAPLLGLALLALPVLPSLDFYCAYPMRLVCAEITAMLLRLGGLGVAADGVGLRWNGSLLLFDAACSGIRMLWAGALLASAAALVLRLGFAAYARALAVAFAAALAANAVRAAGLFYLENGFVERLRGPVWHEAVGLACFASAAAATLALVVPRRGRAA
jgi:exosortase/archaeosortase family protein